MGKKNVAKSIRMTDEVFHYVDSFDGNGFNEKFENLVLMMMQTENDIKKRIEFEQDSLQRLTDEYMKKRAILDKIRSIEYSIENVLKVFSDSK